MAFKTSKTGIDLIKSFEGCSLKAYRCPANVLTIGYGHTGGVKEGQSITQAEAERLLKVDLGSYEAAVNKYVTAIINQNQFDALVSFAYNCGCGALQKSTLLKYLNRSMYKEAADQFDLWNKGGGKVLKGLVRRRAAEKELFLTPIKFTVIEEDNELFEAVRKIILRGISLNINSWKRLDLINLNNVPALLQKLGGLDKLVEVGIIGQKDIWLKKQYNANHVRALLIKYASKL